MTTNQPPGHDHHIDKVSANDGNAVGVNYGVLNYFAGSVNCLAGPLARPLDYEVATHNPAPISTDVTVRLWDPATGQPRGGPLTGHTGGVNHLAIGTVDGHLIIASASSDATVRLWDPAVGQPIGTPLTGHDGQVHAVALSVIDGRAVLASAGADATVRLWDPSTGQPLGDPLKGHKGWVYAVAFGALDGHPVLASAGADFTVRLWDPTTGEPLDDPFTGHAGRVGRCSLRRSTRPPSARFRWPRRSGVAMGSRHRLSASYPLTGHTGRIASIAFGTVDGFEVLASAGSDRIPILWP